MRREIIDVHTHCFAGPGDSARVARGLQAARSAGLSRMVVVGLVNTHLDAEAMWGLVPRSVDYRGDPRFYEVDRLLDFAREHAPTLLPFVDFRHLWGDVDTILQGFMDLGFCGLKGLYLADDGNDLGVRGIPETFGITLKQYHRREWEIFAFAEAHDLPLVYHMDVRRYPDVAAAILDDFPRMRIDLAHFGISRSALRKLLERCPNVYTDLASMLPHIRRDPASYRDFILDYSDRVCFGTDAFLYATEIVVDYAEAVQALGLPPGVEARVFSHNPRQFLGSALAGAAASPT